MLESHEEDINDRRLEFLKDLRSPIIETIITLVMKSTKMQLHL